MSTDKVPFRWENNWVRGLDGEWKETSEKGGWVQDEGEWKLIPGSGEWNYESDGKMKWVPDKLNKINKIGIDKDG